MNKRYRVGSVFSAGLLFLASAAFGQEPEKKMSSGCEPGTCVSKSFHLPNLSQPYELQDIVNTFRVILEVNHVTPNQSEHTVSLEGSPEQISVAEKLVTVLENFRSSDSHNRSSVLVYAPAGSGEETAESEKVSERSPVAYSKTRCELTSCFIEALYLPNLSISQLQDALKTLHSTVHLSRINMVPSSHAIVFQGTSDQLARAKELLNE